MRAIPCILLSLALIAMAMPADADRQGSWKSGVPTPDSLEEYLAWAEAQNPDLTMVRGPSVAIPSSAFEVMYDATTGALTARALEALVAHEDHGGVPAGCLSLGDLGFLVSPPAAGPACVDAFHTAPVDGGAMGCLLIPCVLVLVGQQPSYGALIIFCAAPTGGVFIMGVIGTPSCSVFTEGSAATSWTRWYGYINSGQSNTPAFGFALH